MLPHTAIWHTVMTVKNIVNRTRTAVLRLCFYVRNSPMLLASEGLRLPGTSTSTSHSLRFPIAQMRSMIPVIVSANRSAEIGRLGLLLGLALAGCGDLEDTFHRLPIEAFTSRSCCFLSAFDRGINRDPRPEAFPKWPPFFVAESASKRVVWGASSSDFPSRHPLSGC